MRYIKTYKGNIKSMEDKVNLLYKSEILSIIEVTDLKMTINNNKAIVVAHFTIKNINNFKECSHISSIRLEKYKRSRILYFSIDDGRKFKLVISDRFLFAKTTGIYYNNIKVGNSTFKNTLTISNLKNIVIDFLNVTGILISINELKESLNIDEKEDKESLESFAY